MQRQGINVSVSVNNDLKLSDDDIDRVSQGVADGAFSGAMEGSKEGTKEGVEEVNRDNITQGIN